MTMIVGILGCGVMGAELAFRLAKQDYSVRVLVRNEAKQFQLKELGVFCSHVPSEVVTGCRLVISFLSNDEASYEVWFGKQGVASVDLSETYCLECSTLSVSYIKEWYCRLNPLCRLAFDAPVTGSIVGMRNGGLTIFASTSEVAVEPIRNILDAFAGRIVFFETIGTGMACKLLYNMMSGSIMVALAEAMAHGERIGLNIESFMELCKEVGVGKHMAQIKGDTVMKQGFSRDDCEDIFISLNNFNKDLSYAMKLSEGAANFFPLSKVTLSIYESAEKLGLGALDYSSVAEVYRQNLSVYI